MTMPSDLVHRRLRVIGQIAEAREETRAAAIEVERAVRQMKSAAFVGQQALGLLTPLVMTAGVAWVLKPAAAGRPRGRLVVALVSLLSVIRAVRRINSVLTPAMRLLNSAGR
ncbi:MAG: hypothetical protein JNN20_00885 [Betaproteobacteria bacterium]|nr:hypothetical protein [Betaproteobacteria bacterium]